MSRPSALISRSSAPGTFNAMSNPRVQRLLALVLVAAIAVGALIGVAATGRQPQAPGPHVKGAPSVQALFRGIPQHGVTLGKPRAPVTLTEFADLQCPFCRHYATAVLPTLIRRYVRTGEVKLVFRNLAFIGPDSERAARVAAAAGVHGRLWQFIDLVYRNQGQENGGYVTTGYLRTVARLAGVDPTTALTQANSRAVDSQLATAGREATRYGVNSTPSFLLAGRSGRADRLSPATLTVPAFTGPIDAALKTG